MAMTRRLSDAQTGMRARRDLIDRVVDRELPRYVDAMRRLAE